MDNCGQACILFIWSGLLWPLIVPGFYLIIKRQQITSKGKFFLLCSFYGYVLLIGCDFFIIFIARILLGPDSEVEMKTLAMAITVILFISPIILSHVMSKKYSSQISGDQSKTRGRRLLPMTTLIKLFFVAFAGILVATALEKAVQLLWVSYYSHYPWEGYQNAMASGLVEPGFYNSTKSFLHSTILFFVCGIVIVFYDRKKIFIFAIIFLFFAHLTLTEFVDLTPAVQKDDNLAPLTPFFILLYIGPPFAMGIVSGLFISFVRSRFSKHVRIDS